MKTPPKTVYVKVCKIARRYWKTFLGVCLSLFMLLGSLYQIEIATICGLEGRLFDWPFYVLPSLDPWVARDIFYLGVVASWIILFVTLWYTE